MSLTSRSSSSASTSIDSLKEDRLKLERYLVLVTEKKHKILQDVLREDETQRKVSERMTCMDG